MSPKIAGCNPIIFTIDNSFTAHLTVARPLLPCNCLALEQRWMGVKVLCDIKVLAKSRAIHIRKLTNVPSKGTISIGNTSSSHQFSVDNSLVFWRVNVTPGAYEKLETSWNLSPSGLIPSFLVPFPLRWPSISFWSWTSCFWILADDYIPDVERSYSPATKMHS